jgi:hypothetical protein
LELGERHELGSVKTVGKNDPSPEIRRVVCDIIGGCEAGWGKGHVIGECGLLLESLSYLGDTHEIAFRRNGLASEPYGGWDASGLIQLVLNV